MIGRAQAYLDMDGIEEIQIELQIEYEVEKQEEATSAWDAPVGTLHVGILKIEAVVRNKTDGQKTACVDVTDVFTQHQKNMIAESIRMKNE